MSCNLATYGACGLVSKRRTKDGGCKSYFVHGSFRSVFWKIPGYTVFEMRALPVLVPFIRIFILGALRDARQRTEVNLHARLRQDHIDKPGLAHSGPAHFFLPSLVILFFWARDYVSG